LRFKKNKIDFNKFKKLITAVILFYFIDAHNFILCKTQKYKKLYIFHFLYEL